jgi:hypothetical protein
MSMGTTIVESKKVATQESEHFEGLLGGASSGPRLDVGVEVLVSSCVKTKPFKCRTKICGWYERELLILAAPIVGGKPIELAVGDNTTVRFVNDGTVFGFNSVLLRRINEPKHLWLMSYPEVCERVNLREYNRIPLLLLASADGVKDNVLVLNLSKGGALLEVNGEMRVGDRTALSCILPSGVSVSGLGVIVKNVAKVNGTFQVGVALKDGNPEALRAVRDFFETMRAGVRR